jgi:hypothetical protein
MLSLARYHRLLRADGCMVTGRKQDIGLHHVHGGSVKARGVTRGVRQKVSDWLVIPLWHEIHCIGPNAIDGGRISVEEWERRYGLQAQFIDQLATRYSIDVWAKALEQDARRRRAA